MVVVDEENILIFLLRKSKMSQSYRCYTNMGGNWKVVPHQLVPSFCFNIRWENLIVRSHKVWNQQNLVFRCSYSFEIWQVTRQLCCRATCQISKPFEKLKTLFSSLQNFSRFYDKTSYVIMKWSPSSLMLAPPLLLLCNFLHWDINQGCQRHQQRQ